MKVFNNIGTKERFIEMFQRVNKGVQLNESFEQSQNTYDAGQNDIQLNDNMEEQYRTAIERIDSIPYKKGTETMVKNSEYADEKPTNPALRAGDALNKFVKEELEDMLGSDEIEYNPEDVENLSINPDDETETGEDDEQQVDPDTLQVPEQEDVPEEKKRIILQAYDNLIERAKQQRRFDYTPTQIDVENEILRLTGKNVVKEKNRVFPKEAEPFLESEVMTTDNMQKSLSPEKKAEYILKAKEFLEAQLGSSDFYGMTPEERNRVIAYNANQIFVAEMAQGNKGMGMNEEEQFGDYPDPIGKKFKPKSNYPKKKRKSHSTVNLGEEVDIENDVDTDGTVEPGNDIEQLAKEKESTGDVLRGGKADDKSALDYPQDQVKMGVDVEKEHTEDPLIAIEIALDHLEEFPDYYTRLDAMEKEAGSEHGEEEKPHESGAYLQDGMPGDMDRNGHPIPTIDPDFSKIYPFNLDGKVTNRHPLADILDDNGTAEDLSKTNSGRKGINRAISSDDKEVTDELLGFKPMNVGETIDDGYDFAAKEREFGNEDSYKKYMEYSEKDFNTLNDTDKEEYFQLWKQFKGAEKENGVVGEESSLNVNEESEKSKTVINEEQVKIARQALNKRGLKEGMTKKEAVQILIAKNVKKIL